MVLREVLQHEPVLVVLVLLGLLLLGLVLVLLLLLLELLLETWSWLWWCCCCSWGLLPRLLLELLLQERGSWWCGSTLARRRRLLCRHCGFPGSTGGLLPLLLPCFPDRRSSCHRCAAPLICPLHDDTESHV